LVHQIFFRGSIAIGTFYVNEETNTVMGQAVTDAAAWYDKADWIGVHATPRTTFLTQRLLERDGEEKGHVLIDYDVPLKTGTKLKAKALNWPRAFFVNAVSPCKPNEQPRERLLELLAADRIPSGTEQKFFNALEFYDISVKRINREARLTDRSNRRQSSRR
jgi:hypothetical protein